jgi:hypothetical protein
LYLRRSSKVAFLHALDDQLPLAIGKFAIGHVHAEVVVASQRQQLLQFMLVGGRIPRRDGTLLEALGSVGHDQLHVRVDDVAEPLALRTGAQRAVEAIEPRLRHWIAQAAVLAAQFGAVCRFQPRRCVYGARDGAGQHRSRAGRLRVDQDLDFAASFLKGGFQRVAQPLIARGAGGQSIDNGQHPAGRLVFERRRPGLTVQVDQPAADNQSNKTFLLKGRPQHALIAAGWQHREGHQVSRPLGQPLQHVAHRLGRVPAHLLAATVAINAADLGEQQAQIVARLGGGAHGRAARTAGVLVRHGDRRGDAVDPLCLGLFQPFEELPSVGREAVDITSLPLGIEGVEGQAGLAAAAQPAQHDQPVVRNIQVELLQIVHRDAAERDGASGHILPRVCDGSKLVS